MVEVSDSLDFEVIGAFGTEGSRTSSVPVVRPSQERKREREDEGDGFRGILEPRFC